MAVTETGSREGVCRGDTDRRRVPEAHATRFVLPGRRHSDIPEPDSAALGRGRRLVWFGFVNARLDLPSMADLWREL